MGIRVERGRTGSHVAEKVFSLAGLGFQPKLTCLPSSGLQPLSYVVKVDRERRVLNDRLGVQDTGVIDVMPVRGRVAVCPPLAPRVSIIA
jgi:hypothetical protein